MLQILQLVLQYIHLLALYEVVTYEMSVRTFQVIHLESIKEYIICLQYSLRKTEWKSMFFYFVHFSFEMLKALLFSLA